MRNTSMVFWSGLCLSLPICAGCCRDHGDAKVDRPRPLVQTVPPTTVSTSKEPATIHLDIQHEASISSDSPIGATLVLENSGSNKFWMEQPGNILSGWDVSCSIGNRPVPQKVEFTTKNGVIKDDVVREFDPGAREITTVDLRQIFFFREPGKYSFSFKRGIWAEAADGSKKLRLLRVEAVVEFRQFKGVGKGDASR